LWYIVWDKAGFSLTRELAKRLNIPIDRPEKIGEALGKLTAEQKAFMLRRVMMEQYSGNYPRSAYGMIMRKIAAGYGDIAIQDFENEQKAIREKRESRAKERLKKLSVVDDKTKKNGKAKMKKKKKVLA
jgi:hypothetical protein